MRPALLLLSVACAAHHAHVFVPASSRPCWEACNARAKDCDPGEMPDAESYTNAGTLASAQHERDLCEDKRHDCLLSCPGAREDGS